MSNYIIKNGTIIDVENGNTYVGSIEIEQNTVKKIFKGDDARKDIKEAKLPEDTTKRAEKEIDDLTKEYSDKVEAEFKAKEAEIMKI